MSRTRAVAATIAALAGWLLLLELGPVSRAAEALRAAGGPVAEIDVIRAYAWLVALLGALPVYAALRVRPPPAALTGVLADRDWLLGLLDGMSEGVVAFDQNGRVVFANPAALALLGRRGLPDGTPMVAFGDVPRLRSTVVAALRGGAPVMREIQVPGPPPRNAILRATPTRHGAVAILLDVSDQRRIERSWRDFAANASHELRTPAAAVLANLEVLAAADDVDPEDRRRFVDASLRQARRLAGLVGDLLDLVGLESGTVPLNIEPVRVDDAAARVLEEHPGPDPVVVDLGGVVVYADPTGVRQILANLVSNARRYAPGPLELRAHLRGTRFRIELADRGPGIAAEHLPHLFERFYRIDPGRSRAAGGTGLGLAIVRELCLAMGGQAGARPRDGGGTVFWVDLPATAEVAARTPVPVR